MARAEAHQSQAPAGLWQSKGVRAGKAMAGYARQLSHPAYESLLRSETFLRRLVPILIIVFMIITGFARWVSLSQQHEYITTQANSEMHFIGELLQQKLLKEANFTGSQSSLNEIQNVLSDTVPVEYLSHDRHVYLTDASNRIVANLPYEETLIGQFMDDVYKETDLLTTYDNRTVLQEIKLPSGEPSIAVHRLLSEPFGGIILIQPQTKLFASWNKAVSINVTLFVGTSSIFLVILYAYYAQSARAREADSIYFEVQKRFDSAMIRAGCGLWDWDLTRGKFYWSQSMFEILGRPPRDEIISFTEISEWVHSDDINLYEFACLALEKKTTAKEATFRMQHADGQWRWIRLKAEKNNNSPSRPRLVGIAEDITEHRNKEKASQKKDIQLLDAVENMPETFVLWDNEKRLVMCNSKYIKLHKLEFEKISQGMHIKEIMKMATSPNVSSRLVRALDEDETTKIMEAQLDDGRWLQINERHTREGGFVSIGTDITSLKLHENKLKDSETRLMATVSDLERSRQTLEIQKQKLAEMAEQFALAKQRAELANRTKSEFLANISHELRTPLNAIIGFSEIMNECMFGPLGSDKYIEYARDIHESGSYLLGMINDVLDMSKIEAGRFPLSYDTFNLSDIMEETIRIIGQQSEERNIEIIDETTEQLLVEADRRAIKQILINLLSNAVKFSNEGGYIKIRTKEIGSSVAISIEDNGIGISASDLERLGRPFEQVQNQFTKSHKGSGLGLAISRSLTQMHKGNMKIFSKEGAGTIVSLRVPKLRYPVKNKAA